METIIKAPLLGIRHDAYSMGKFVDAQLCRVQINIFGFWVTTKIKHRLDRPKWLTNPRWYRKVFVRQYSYRWDENRVFHCISPPIQDIYGMWFIAETVFIDKTP